MQRLPDQLVPRPTFVPSAASWKTEAALDERYGVFLRAYEAWNRAMVHTVVRATMDDTPARVAPAIRSMPLVVQRVPLLVYAADEVSITFMSDVYYDAARAIWGDDPHFLSTAWKNAVHQLLQRTARGAIGNETGPRPDPRFAVFPEQEVRYRRGDPVYTREWLYRGGPVEQYRLADARHIAATLPTGARSIGTSVDRTYHPLQMMREIVNLSKSILLSRPPMSEDELNDRPV